MNSEHAGNSVFAASAQGTRAAHLMRMAVQRELESELRGLIMAARLHGFRLAIEGEDMSYRAIDTNG
ncbi:hypothetical protein [Ramlibacter tataouinensis]|uniref:hypothetical protein n=1 Tax=Ramlibacter tataouinensis TaxID=94132 RepID=UPI0011AE9C78|nr:hypothetical protein [Ramlibacter tataouinensis]